MMKHFQVLTLLLLMESLCHGSESETDFFVSPTGSDAWTGTLSEPNAAASDGPFATLVRARDAVADLNRDNPRDIVVLVREGVYSLERTVVFGTKDSGLGDSTVT